MALSEKHLVEFFLRAKGIEITAERAEAQKQWLEEGVIPVTYLREEIDGSFSTAKDPLQAVGQNAQLVQMMQNDRAMTNSDLKESIAQLRKAETALADASAGYDRAALEAARTALRQEHGFIKRAAAALGWYRLRLLRLLKQHPELERDAESWRRASGWVGGRPGNKDAHEG